MLEGENAWQEYNNRHTLYLWHKIAVSREKIPKSEFMRQAVLFMRLTLRPGHNDQFFNILNVKND